MIATLLALLSSLLFALCSPHINFVLLTLTHAAVLMVAHLWLLSPNAHMRTQSPPLTCFRPERAVAVQVDFEVPKERLLHDLCQQRKQVIHIQPLY